MPMSRGENLLPSSHRLDGHTSRKEAFSAGTAFRPSARPQPCRRLGYAMPCLAMPCHALPCLAMPCHAGGKARHGKAWPKLKRGQEASSRRGPPKTSPRRQRDAAGPPNPTRGRRAAGFPRRKDSFPPVLQCGRSTLIFVARRHRFRDGRLPSTLSPSRRPFLQGPCYLPALKGRPNSLRRASASRLVFDVVTIEMSIPRI
jgi:hypothetical protein